MLQRKHFLLLLINLGCMPLLWAAPQVPAELSNNGLIYCTQTNSFSLNPQTVDAGTNMNVVTEQIYNKLFELKNNDDKLSPALAQSYWVSADGKEIYIQLRQGVKFHHTPWFTPTRDFNSSDVVFSLNRILGHDTSLPEFDSEEQKSDHRQYKIFHQQAKKVHFPYFESIKLNEKIASVEALDPYQVKITLFQPDASILSHLASQYAVIFSQEYALQLNADDNLMQLDMLPVGTGPYQLKDYQRNQYVRLQRNKDFWNKDAKIDNIVIDLTTERNGRLAKFFNGECHIVAFPEFSQLGLLQKENLHFQTQFSEGMNLAFLAFNFQKAKMHDIALRQAISQAINRKRIIQDIYYNTANLANHILPPISWAADNQSPPYAYDYHPEQAKAFFQNKNINLVMWVLNDEQVYNPAPLKMAELIRFDLAQVGVRVKVKSVTRNYLIEQLKNKTEDYDMILTGWLASTLDPDSFIRPILSCATQMDITNLANWCYPAFDQLINQALTNEQKTLRAKEYAQAQQVLENQVPIVPIAHVKRVLLINTRVKGVTTSPFGNMNFEQLSLKKEDNE